MFLAHNADGCVRQLDRLIVFFIGVVRAWDSLRFGPLGARDLVVILEGSIHSLAGPFVRGGVPRKQPVAEQTQPTFFSLREGCPQPEGWAGGDDGGD